VVSLWPVDSGMYVRLRTLAAGTVGPVRTDEALLERRTETERPIVGPIQAVVDTPTHCAGIAAGYIARRVIATGP